MHIVAPLKHHPQAPSSCLKVDLWSRYSTLSLTPFSFQRNNRKKELQIFTLSHTFWWQFFHHQRELHSTNYKHPTPDTRGNKRKIIKLLHKFVYELCTNCLCTQVLLQMGCACVSVCWCVPADRQILFNNNKRWEGAGESIYPRK